MDIDEITGEIINTAMEIHMDLGPGLLESVYECILAKMLAEKGFFIETQKAISFNYKGIHFSQGFRCDLLVNQCVVVELKSIEKINPVHKKQLLSYLRLMNLEVGLLINFGGDTLKDGLYRIVNHYKSSSDSILDINKVFE